MPALGVEQAPNLVGQIGEILWVEGATWARNSARSSSSLAVSPPAPLPEEDAEEEEESAACCWK
jgi:hypothetical protein